jgi:hypothetical protein
MTDPQAWEAMMEWLLTAAHTPDRKVGTRIPEFDARSRAWRVRDLLDSFSSLPERVEVWTPHQPTLDQRLTSFCVPFSIAHWIAGEPFPEDTEVVDEEFAIDLATMIRRNEKIRTQGMSILDGLKGAQEDGWISEYYWCGAGSGTVIEDIVDAVQILGGIILGVDWQESMYSPRPSGLMEVSYNGNFTPHCVYVTGAVLGKPIIGEDSTPRDYLVIQNSWGTDWGNDGFCMIELDALEELMTHQGEAAVPTKFPLIDFVGQDLVREKIGMKHGMTFNESEGVADPLEDD